MKPILPSILTTAFMLGASAHAVVTLDWVTVADTGNGNDPGTGSTWGAVPYLYKIMKYEVTNAQYAEFLNAKAASDPNGLYNANMGTAAVGGIIQSGISGSYSYNVKSGYEDMPVVYVSHLDAQRFTNWIHNGQGAGDTETGAYTVGSLATHTLSADVWLPTANEWYKAAYYHPQAAGGPSDSYWTYPTRTDTTPVSATPPSASPARANFYYTDGIANGVNGGYAVTQSTSYNASINYLSEVGAYSITSTYYGTFDQGGSVWEWNDGVYGSNRGLRGGSWDHDQFSMRAITHNDTLPTSESGVIGFRLASQIPEPSRALLLLGGLMSLALRRRRNIV